MQSPPGYIRHLPGLTVPDQELSLQRVASLEILKLPHQGRRMHRRTAVVLAGLLISGIVGLQVLEIAMRAATNRWMEQGVVIPLYGRILLGVADFWVDFKWLLALPILIAFLLIALLAKRDAKGVRA